jgi:hypothetical protein
MKVPQPAQGYPSDARSSRPHERQIMASEAGFASLMGGRGKWELGNGKWESPGVGRVSESAAPI